MGNFLKHIIMAAKLYFNYFKAEQSAMLFAIVYYTAIGIAKVSLLASRRRYILETNGTYRADTYWSARPNGDTTLKDLKSQG